MDIRSKLGIYHNASQSNASQSNASQSNASQSNAGHGSACQEDVNRYARRNSKATSSSLPGVVINNDDGEIFLLENRYPVNYLYGGFSLGDALDIKPELLAQISGTSRTVAGKLKTATISDTPAASSNFPQADQLLFLDTETTGLSGGAGTVAFLVGVGFFEGDEFVVRQYFMRDYDEEPAMLRELNVLLSSFDGLVTFNGRSFDWNLLYNRFIQNRIKPCVREPINIDLLFPARRIWSLKLESCKLSSLEENVLNEHRIDDIPGALIPSVYFKYLEEGVSSDIKRVISHNEFDILSMVALLVKMAVMLDSPQLDSPGYELIGVGRILQAGVNITCSDVNFKGSDDTVYTECFEACAKSEIYMVKTAAVKHLTDIYKKSGNYERALGHWLTMAEDSNGFNLAPMVELAKYYEHKEKNIKKALEIVNCAVCSGVESGMTGGRQFKELRRRQERLSCKAAKQSGNY